MSGQFGHSSAVAAQWENTMQMQKSQFISVCPLSAVGHGGWIIVMPALIQQPGVGSGRGEHGKMGTEGTKGQHVRYDWESTCRWSFFSSQ